LEKQGKTDPNQVDLQDLEAYMAELGGEHRNHQERDIIHQVFLWLKQYGYLTNNVAEGLFPPAREYQEPRVLTTREFRALLRACTHDIRDAAI
jgi:site-specific recombinase XerD